MVAGSQRGQTGQGGGSQLGASEQSPALRPGWPRGGLRGAHPRHFLDRPELLLTQGEVFKILVKNDFAKAAAGLRGPPPSQ